MSSKKIACPHCGKEYPKKGIGTHIWRAHGTGKNHTSSPKGRKAWNKGLTKEDPRVKKIADKASVTKRKQVVEGLFVVPKMSEAARKRQSIRMSENNPGGRCSWYVVDGRKVQGRWERDLAKHFCSLGIEWKRPQHLSYTKDGKEHRYTPDFFLPEIDCYLEIKGFWWGDDKRKMKCVFKQHNELKIRVLEKELFESILSQSLKENIFGLLA